MSWICEGRKAFTPWTGPPEVPGDAQRYTESGNGFLNYHNCRSGAESGDLSSWASDHTTSGQREVRYQSGVGRKSEEWKCLEAKDAGSSGRGTAGGQVNTFWELGFK